jgi:NADPH2:quinone reductase
MQAVWYERLGPAREVLVVGELAKPSPGRREVLVEVHASAVNPSDTAFRRGVYGPMGYPRIVPNSTGAGVVVEVGEFVSSSMVGQRVWFFGGQREGRVNGAAAEYVALGVDQVRELPQDVSYVEGATLGVPAMTAHVSLFAHGPVQGRTVVVTGAAGACGGYAVQIAKWAGATVIGTVSSPQKAEIARAAGADDVVNYKTENLTERLAELVGNEGVDHVVDVDLAANFNSIAPVMRFCGGYAAYMTNSNRTPSLNMGEAIRRNLILYNLALPYCPFEARKRAGDDITRWAGSGRRIHAVSSIHPLAEMAAAHEAVERGDKQGTVVVTVR